MSDVSVFSWPPSQADQERIRQYAEQARIESARRLSVIKARLREEAAEVGLKVLQGRKMNGFYVHHPERVQPIWYKPGGALSIEPPSVRYDLPMPTTVYRLAYAGPTDPHVLYLNHVQLFFKRRHNVFPNRGCQGAGSDMYWPLYSLGQLLTRYWQFGFNNDYGVSWVRYGLFRQMRATGLVDPYAKVTEYFQTWERLSMDEVKTLLVPTYTPEEMAV